LLQAVTISAITTRSVGATDRVHYWRDIISSHFGGLELQCWDGSQAFDARLVTINLGSIKVSRVSSTAHEVIRTQRAIDRCDSDSFLIEVPLRGSATLVQLEQEAVVHPGDFALCDNARPFRYRFQSSFEEVVIEIPRRSLLARNARLDRMAPLLVSGGSDMGMLIAPLLHRLGEAPKLGESPVAAQLGSSLIDLVATALSDQVGTPGRVPDRIRYLSQARAFIRDHLADSDISPSRTAYAIGISPRYLHALFHDDGCSVSKWIFQCRLERARVLLVDAARKDSTITEIAHEVGFKDLAHFSRAFKAEFGVMPSSFRTQHQDPEVRVGRPIG
jgi:AraC-like DNA-binding protein